MLGLPPDGTEAFEEWEGVRRHATRYQSRHDTSASGPTPAKEPGCRTYVSVDPAEKEKVPVCEIDPWRMQYFTRVPCPADVFIPTEDSDAWLWNPTHRWVYDKLAVAMSQGLDAAPHGVSPVHYPVFSKPIYNLKGMGVGSRRLQSESDYIAAYQPGHFWSTLLEATMSAVTWW